jgi:uncharacterized membrane protein
MIVMPGLFALIYGLTGLLFIGLGIPLAMQKVPPNEYYGTRTPKTLSNSAIWYAANRAGGIDLIVAGGVVVAGVLAMFILEETAIPSFPIWIAGLILIVAAAAVAAIHASRVAKRL